MTNSSTINPDLVKVARQAIGLSQSELAARVQVSQGAISKIESGLLQPQEEVLERLSSELNVPSSMLFEPDRVFGLPMSVHFRKRASVRKRAVEALEAEVNLRLFHLRRLLRAVDLQPELELPCLDVDEFGGDGEAVASMLRKVWLVPSGPIRNLTELIERAGGIVFSCDFDQAGVDGLTLRAPGLPTCIFLNSKAPADRQRFTLAHELGHVVMHRFPTPNMEEEADAFAAGLLVPRAEFRDQVSGTAIDLPRLAALKPHWRVSMGALLYRAKKTGLLSESRATALWKQMAIAGYKKREPPELDFPSESPTVLSAIFKSHLEDLGYSAEELAAALHARPSEIERLHSRHLRPRPRLELVR